MGMRKVIVGGSTALFLLATIPPGVALAHPGEPDLNFAKLYASGFACDNVRGITNQVHDARGNTYAYAGDACANYLDGGVPVYWWGPGH